MSNSSSVQGYITIPAVPAHMGDRLDQNFILDTSKLAVANILDDDMLFDFFHDYIAGITGIVGSSIIPRWQIDPPNIQDFGNDWCAFGITNYKADTFVAEVQKVGNAEIHRHEVMDILISFYGNNATGFARLFRDGMQVSQNLEALSLNNMGLVESGDIVNVPSLVKERWLHRVDMPFSIKRQIVRTYPIVELLKANILVYNERFTETINI